MGEPIDFASWESSWEGENACSIFLRDSNKIRSIEIDQFNNEKGNEIGSKVKADRDDDFDEKKVDMTGIYDFANDQDEICAMGLGHDNENEETKSEHKLINNNHIISCNCSNGEKVAVDKEHQEEPRYVKTETVESCDIIKGNNSRKKKEIRFYDLTKACGYKSSYGFLNTNYFPENRSNSEPIEVFDFTSSRGYFQSIKEERIDKTEWAFEDGNIEEEKYNITDIFQNQSTNLIKTESSDDKEVTDGIEESTGNNDNVESVDGNSLSENSDCDEDDDDDDDPEYDPDNDDDDDDNYNDIEKNEDGTKKSKSKGKASKRKKKKKRVKLKLPKKLLRRSGRIVDEKLRCKICGHQAKITHSLTIHMRKHTGERPFKCKLCDKTYTQSSALSEHLISHSEVKPHKCEQCDSKFHRKAGLIEHARVHTDERPFKCEMCELSFKQRSTMKSHMLTHTDLRPHKCNLCKMRFRQKKTWQNHMMVHNGEKPYKCELCDKRFVRTDGLQVHMRRHTGDSPYQCKICSNRFRTCSSLKRHSLLHFDERKFKCNFKSCISAFRRKDQLEDHMKMHTGIKPFKCETCDKGFARKFGLLLHQRTHTGERPHPCKYCSSRFSCTSGLKRHTKRKHKDKIQPKESSSTKEKP